MKSYTVNELMTEATPCDVWTRDRVAALYAAYGRTRVSALDVLRCGDLSDRDALFQCSRMVNRRTRIWLGTLATEQVENLMSPAVRAAAYTAAINTAAYTAAADFAAIAYIYVYAHPSNSASRAAAIANATLATIRELWIAALEAI